MVGVEDIKYNGWEYSLRVQCSITLVLYLDTLGLYFGCHECFKISNLVTCEGIIGPAEKMQENERICFGSWKGISCKNSTTLYLERV